MFVESEIREKAYRFVAYSAVGFSLVSILAVFVTLPMVNNYVNSVHNRVHHEMEFCKVFFDETTRTILLKISAKEVMLEMNEYKALPKLHVPQLLHLDRLNVNGTRFKRGVASIQCEGLFVSIARTILYPLFSGCCLPGAPGPVTLKYSSVTLMQLSLDHLEETEYLVWNGSQQQINDDDLGRPGAVRIWSTVCLGFGGRLTVSF